MGTDQNDNNAGNPPNSEAAGDGVTARPRPSVKGKDGSEGMAPDGEQRLVEAAIRGDQAALRGLWHEHRRWVAAVLLASKPRDADLDDLLQDVAAQLVAKIQGLREAGAFKPWLRAVALNVAKTAGRKRSVRVAAALKLIGGTKEESSEPDVSTARATEEEGRRLMRLAAQLPDGYREPLLLRCVQGMGYREIGAVTGLPETTIETRIARGRRMLRELAEKEGMGEKKEEASVVGTIARGREVLNG